MNDIFNQLFNHVWQSTAFAVVVAVAAALLRRNSPRLRYWLWLAGSVKFLIPFSLLVATGSRVQLPPDTPSLHAVTVQRISTYFAPVPAAPVHATIPWAQMLTAIWLCGVLFLLVRWLRRWRTIHIAARRATRLALPYRIQVLSSPDAIEPGVFGIFRPVLLLPQGITDNLTPEQFDAILAHELRHIRYRDNLTAALHMCVETLFWFHPLTWWIGARLTEERERDCDEAVLREGNRPADYARGIVNVCETYLESPLVCASGITGSDLKRRIREIMTWRVSLPMTLPGKAMLAAAAFAVMSIPFAIGILRAQTLPPAPAYTYDAVSIHRSDPNEENVHNGNDGPQGGFRSVNTSVLLLISVAYGVQDYQIVDAPAWTSSRRYDVVLTPGKTEPVAESEKTMAEFQTNWKRNQQRLQAVLRDRFGLVLRAETRELPIYVMTRMKGGNKLSAPDAGDRMPSVQTNGDRQITGTPATMKMLAEQLSMQLGRPVHDETHIEGAYDLRIDWIPDPDLRDDPAIVNAVADQLGLRLESTKGPVQVYVVEKIEQPSEN